MRPRFPTLLIVEDDPSILFALRQYFCSFGFAADAVPSVQDAEVYLTSFGYDAMITDLSFTGPGSLEGAALVAFARRACPGIRTILLSAWISEEGRALAVRAGIDLVLHKPQRLGALLAYVNDLLARGDGSAPASNPEVAARYLN
jgi:DNA-binding response OmpR family regulator